MNKKSSLILLVLLIPLALALDTTAPNITINSPLNGSVYNIQTVIFNITAIDDVNVSSCWYSLDLGITNLTMSNISTSWNATNSSMTNGNYLASFYCNDTSNNLATNSSNFTVSLTPLSINVTAPLNGSTLSFPGMINVTVNVSAASYLGIQSYWYSLDSGNNLTFNQSVGIYIQQVNGETKAHNLYVWVNDTSGNQTFQFISFTVAQTGEVGTGAISSSSSQANTEENLSLNITENLNQTLEEGCSINDTTGVKTCITSFVDKIWPEHSFNNFLIFIIVLVVLIVILEENGTGPSYWRQKLRERKKPEEE